MPIVTQDTPPSTPIAEPCLCERCRADDIDAPAGQWPAWVDEFVWTISEPAGDDETADDHLHNAAGPSHRGDHLETR